MPYKICVPQGNPPKLVCYHIPALIRKWRPKPEPDPFFRRVLDAIRLVFKPQPDPWMSVSLAGLGIAEEVVRDARILATVEELATEATPALRGALQQSVSSMAATLRLPQGAQLEKAA